MLARLAMALVAVAGIASAASAEKRGALIVGNSDYEFIAKLKNPKNDAEDLTAKLRDLGFEVFGGADLERRTLVSSLIQFGRAAENADVALFYYAGHGLQVNGQNYLVPVDAMVEFEAEIDISLVSLTGVMRQLERGSKTNLIFLDACRDNPFADKLKSSTRSAVPLSKGLTRVQSNSGTFIAFATQPDAVASDGSGRNSPFSTALLKHIDEKGQSISDMMIDVRNDVMAQTNGAQVPWDSSSLVGRFSFVPADETATAQSSPVATAGSGVSDKEAYELAVATGTCGAFEAFIRRFPDSFFTDLAKEQAESACGEDAATADASADDGSGADAANADPNADDGSDTTVALAQPPEDEVTLSRALTPASHDPEEICDDGEDISYCATSVLDPQGKNKYSPAMLFDGNPATAWVENDEGAGLGQSITLYFSGERQLAGFDILNGYDKDEKTWANNSRVKGATLELSNGKSFAIELPDVRDTNRFSFSKPVKTESVTITIDSVYEGAKFADTAISELYPVFAD
ncbi:MAG: caspase family protein [Rhizobiaceae bacterium]